MDVSEQRVIGSLLLLMGFSCLAVGLYNGQLSLVTDFVKRIFEAAISGMP